MDKEKKLYKPVKSTKAGKKGQVYVIKDGKKKLIHFGDSTYKDFKSGASKKQRKSYLKRSAGIKNKDGMSVASLARQYNIEKIVGWLEDNGSS